MQPDITWRQNLRTRFLSGKTSVSVTVDFPSQSLVEFLGITGFADSIMLDLEHGTMSDRDVEALVAQADLYQLPTLVRLPYSETARVQRFLDSGAVGWVVPSVESPEQASEAAALIRYFPAGRRGYGRSRLTGYGIGRRWSDLGDEENEVATLIVQIETIEGLSRRDDIIKVDGVDGVLVGAVDLSASMGIPGEVGSNQVKEAVAAIARSATSSGKGLMLGASNPAGLAAAGNLGATLISVSAMSLMANGIEVFRATMPVLDSNK